MKRPSLIIGVDPGTVVTGYALLKATSSFELLDYGCIRPKTDLPLPLRYRFIFEKLSSLLDHHTPSALAVESQFVQKNVSSAIKLGMCRGIILLSATLREIPTFEYSPSQAKLSVTGSGRASKEQIERMVRLLCNIKGEKIPEDAADAIAIAICHANMSCKCTPLSVES